MTSETPADKVLKAIECRLRISRDKVERSILKDILLRAGISEISNKTNKGYFLEMTGYPSKKNINPNSPTHRWAKSLLEDELKGQKKISIKISTHVAITEVSTQRSGATYDDIILAALSSYKREQEIGPQSLESISNEETEDNEEV